MKYNYYVSGKITNANGSKGKKYIGYNASALLTLDHDQDSTCKISGKLIGLYNIDGDLVLDQVSEDKRSFENEIATIIDRRINYSKDIENGKATLNISVILSDNSFGKWEIGEGTVSVVVNSWLWRFLLKSISGTIVATLNSKE